jgi:hypothetical protein
LIIISSRWNNLDLIEKLAMIMPHTIDAIEGVVSADTIMIINTAQIPT